MDTDPALASIVLGLVLLGVDIFIIGLSPMMFVALGALATGAGLYAAGLRPSLVATGAVVAVASLLIALIGKGPLQAFQNQDVQEDETSDLIGRELVTTHEVTKSAGVVYWSGVEWQARLAGDAPLEKVEPGVRMTVVKVVDLALVLRPA